MLGKCFKHKTNALWHGFADSITFGDSIHNQCDVPPITLYGMNSSENTWWMFQVQSICIVTWLRRYNCFGDIMLNTTIVADERHVWGRPSDTQDRLTGVWRQNSLDLGQRLKSWSGHKVLEKNCGRGVMRSLEPIFWLESRNMLFTAPLKSPSALCHAHKLWVR